MFLTKKLKKHYNSGLLLGLSAVLTFFGIGLRFPLLAYPEGCSYPHTSYSSYLKVWNSVAGNKVHFIFTSTVATLSYPANVVGAYYRNSTIDDKLCEENRSKLEKKLFN